MYNNRDSFRFFLFVSLSKFSESNDYLNHLKILELVSNESESTFDHCVGFHSFVIIWDICLNSSSSVASSVSQAFLLLWYSERCSFSSFLGALHFIRFYDQKAVSTTCSCPIKNFQRENWMSYYRKFKDFIGKMQTNKLPVWQSGALPKNGLIILSFFEFERAAGRLQSHFLLPKR